MNFKQQYKRQGYWPHSLRSFFQKIPCSFFISIASFAPNFADAWTNPIVGELMQHSQWSTTADDNLREEAIPSSFYKKLVDEYLAKPNDPTATRNLGLLALTIGVSEWGVFGDDVPPDPMGKKWKSNSSARQGKHVMSYDLGGIGISHVDSDELGEFIKFVAEKFIKDDSQRARFLQFADPRIYRRGRIQYDQIRASGLCQGARVSNDLKGESFAEAGHGGVSSKNCADWNNEKLTPTDWQLFRTYVRMALRTEEGQEWIINSWLDRNWAESVSRVLGAGGSIDEALANARVRNSSPMLANAALRSPAANDRDRIQREIDSYSRMNNGVTAQRRCGFILRSIAIYRHHANDAQLAGVKCP